MGQKKSAAHVKVCSIPLIFDLYPPLHNMTVRDILLVHMYFHPSVTINARSNEIYLQYVYYNLLAHILFSTSSYVLVSVLYKVEIPVLVPSQKSNILSSTSS